MKAEIKEKWVKALRSGEYKQCKGYLKLEGEMGVGYCCLGVLCELAVKDNVIPPPVTLFLGTEEAPKGMAYEYGETHDNAFLPNEVSRWAGIKDRCGEIIDDYGISTGSLAIMNDDGAPFDVIANTIEKKF